MVCTRPVQFLWCDTWCHPNEGTTLPLVRAGVSLWAIPPPEYATAHVQWSSTALSTRPPLSRRPHQSNLPRHRHWHLHNQRGYRRHLASTACRIIRSHPRSHPLCRVVDSSARPVGNQWTRPKQNAGHARTGGATGFVAMARTA